MTVATVIAGQVKHIRTTVEQPAASAVTVVSNSVGKNMVTRAVGQEDVVTRRGTIYRAFDKLER